jgi:hypothetical protein
MWQKLKNGWSIPLIICWSYQFTSPCDPVTLLARGEFLRPHVFDSIDCRRPKVLPDDLSPRPLPPRPLSPASPSLVPSRVGVLRPPPTWGAQAAAGCPLLARRASTGRGCCVAPAPDCRGAPATARSEARRPSLIEWCSECSTDIAFAFDHSTLQSFLSDAGSPSGGSCSNAGHLALSFGVPGLMGLFQAFWSVLA